MAKKHMQMYSVAVREVTTEDATSHPITAKITKWNKNPCWGGGGAPGTPYGQCAAGRPLWKTTGQLLKNLAIYVLYNQPCHSTHTQERRKPKSTEDLGPNVPNS